MVRRRAFADAQAGSRITKPFGHQCQFFFHDNAVREAFEALDRRTNEITEHTNTARRRSIRDECIE